MNARALIEFRVSLNLGFCHVSLLALTAALAYLRIGISYIYIYIYILSLFSFLFMFRLLQYDEIYNYVFCKEGVYDTYLVSIYYAAEGLPPSLH